MLQTAVVLALCVGGASRDSLAVETKAAGKTVTLNDLMQKVISGGETGQLPGPIADSISVPKGVPYRGVGVYMDQATDGLDHAVRVLIEKSSDSAAVKPLVLVFQTGRKWPGNAEFNWFHASLDGRLKNASFTHGKRDEQGKIIKGSGGRVEQDINSPEIKDRFKHELDLWLKKSYLKKEWASAEFIDGVLQKKS